MKFSTLLGSGLLMGAALAAPTAAPADTDGNPNSPDYCRCALPQRVGAYRYDGKSICGFPGSSWESQGGVCAMPSSIAYWSRAKCQGAYGDNWIAQCYSCAQANSMFWGNKRVCPK